MEIPFKLKTIFNNLNFSDLENCLKISINYVTTSNTFGDYYEFGSGSSTFFSIDLINDLQKRKNRRVINFVNTYDTFEGLPNDWLSFPKGSFKTDFTKFVNKIRNKKYKKVRIIKGDYKKTLNRKNKFGKASVILIDCDLQSSSKYVFNFITDLIQDGTIIIMDDWKQLNNDKNKGIQKEYYLWKKKIKKFKINDLHETISKKLIIISKL